MKPYNTTEFEDGYPYSMDDSYLNNDDEDDEEE